MFNLLSGQGLGSNNGLLGLGFDFYDIIEYISSIPRFVFRYASFVTKFDVIKYITTFKVQKTEKIFKKLKYE